MVEIETIDEEARATITSFLRHLRIRDFRIKNNPTDRSLWGAMDS